MRRWVGGGKTMVARGWHVILLAAFVVSCVLAGWFAAVSEANPFAELPPDHWVYGAVEGLLNDGFPWDGFEGIFLGKRPVTRYEMAVAVAKILARAEAMDGNGLVVGQLRLSSLGIGPFLTLKERDLIRRLHAEFENELTLIGLRNKAAGLSSAMVDLGTITTAKLNKPEVSGGLALQRTNLPGEVDSGPGGIQGFTPGVGAGIGAFPTEVDSTVRVSDNLTLNATYSRIFQGLIPELNLPVDPDANVIGGLGSKLVLSDAVTVYGGYRVGNVQGSGEKSGIEVGTTIKMGDIEFGASYRDRIETSSDSDKVKEASRAYGFDVRTKVKLSDIVSMGAAYDQVNEGKDNDNLFTTATRSIDLQVGKGTKAELTVGHRVEDKYGSDATLDQTQTLTSVDLKYALMERAILRASYEAQDLSDYTGLGRNARQTTTQLGIDYSLMLTSAAVLKAGYTYEMVRDLIATGVVWTKSASTGLEYQLSKNALLSAKYITVEGLIYGIRTTTSLGLGYNFGQSASLILGYKLIDFTDSVSSDQRTNMATAELTIRF